MQDHLFGNTKGMRVGMLAPSPTRFILLKHSEAYMPTGDDDVSP